MTKNERGSIMPTSPTIIITAYIFCSVIVSPPQKSAHYDEKDPCDYRRVQGPHVQRTHISHSLKFSPVMAVYRLILFRSA